MPIATIQTPDGKTIKLEVPAGATEQQILDFVSSQDLSSASPNAPAPQETTLGEDILGGLETAGTIVSGAFAEPVAGIAGLGAAAFGGAEAGAQMVEDVRQGMTYEPRSEAGKQTLQNIGETVQEYVPEVGKPMGNYVFDLTGNAGLAAAAESTPTLLAELLGLGVLNKLSKGTRLLTPAGEPTKTLRKALDKQGLVFENLTPEAKATIPEISDKATISSQSLTGSNAQKALIQQIKGKATDSSLAGLQVINNKVRADDLGLAAIKQGFDPGSVQAAKVSNPATKAAMRKQLNIMRRIKGNRRVGVDIRPGVITGDAISDRIKYIRNTANDASKELKNIVDTRLADTVVNADNMFKKVDSALTDLRVTTNEYGVLTPDSFKHSAIKTDGAAQTAIKHLLEIVSDIPDGPIKASEIHLIKRQLDNAIDFNKKSRDGLTEEGRRALKAVRHEANQAIRAVDDDYARVNDILSKSISTLDDTQKAMGTSIDIFGKGANDAIGTNARKLMSNYATRVNLKNAIEQLDNTSLELGGRFDTDVKQLAEFANSIEEVFGAAAKTSLKGDIESTNKFAQIGKEAVAGSSQGATMRATDAVFDLGARAIQNAKGINDFNAFEAMDAILKRNN